jgi:hypothetical protein
MSDLFRYWIYHTLWSDAGVELIEIELVPLISSAFSL